MGSANAGAGCRQLSCWSTTSSQSADLIEINLIFLYEQISFKKRKITGNDLFTRKFFSRDAREPRSKLQSCGLIPSEWIECVEQFTSRSVHQSRFRFSLNNFREKSPENHRVNNRDVYFKNLERQWSFSRIFVFSHVNKEKCLAGHERLSWPRKTWRMKIKYFLRNVFRLGGSRRSSTWAEHKRRRLA